MKLICSFCKADLGEKEPLEDMRKTHGICQPCHDWFMEQQDISSLSEYLSTFDIPVIIVSGDGRVVAISNEAEEMLGKSRREVQGVLGGEAMECVYARLPDGCGQAAHCSACTIRNLVEKTLKYKQGFKENVYLEKEGEVVNMTAITEYIGGAVSIQLDI